MLSGLLTALTSETHFVVKRSAFGLAGALFVLLGIIALSAAGWLVFADLYGAVVAWLALAGGFSAIGAIMILWTRRQARMHKLRIMAESSPFALMSKNSRASATAGVAEAFVLGLAAGLKK